jgi:hypothetical protein
MCAMPFTPATVQARYGAGCGPPFDVTQEPQVLWLYGDGPTKILCVKPKKNPNSRRDFLNRYIKS